MKELQIVTFENGTYRSAVSLDNSRFVNCRFEGALLIFSGGPFYIEHCQFGPGCVLALQGSAWWTANLLAQAKSLGIVAKLDTASEGPVQ
jgi:hypothetical protein